MIPLNFSMGDRLPAATVTGKVKKWSVAAGVVPQTYVFLRVRQTPNIIGVSEATANKLIKEKDQQKLRKLMAPLVWAEMQAARSSRPSPGKMLLLEQRGDAIYQVTKTQAPKKSQTKESILRGTIETICKPFRPMNHCHCIML